MKLLLLIPLLALLAACQSTPLPPACSLKPDSGRCRAAIERFWFDESSGVCRTFIWGGCDGSVPFDTLEACQEMCESPAEATPRDSLRPSRGY